MKFYFSFITHVIYKIGKTFGPSISHTNADTARLSTRRHLTTVQRMVTLWLNRQKRKSRKAQTCLENYCQRTQLLKPSSLSYWMAWRPD